MVKYSPIFIHQLDTLLNFPSHLRLLNALVNSIIMNSIRIIPRLTRAFPQTGRLALRRPFLLGSTTAIKSFSSYSALKSSRVAPVAPGKTQNAKEAPSTQKGLPEFNLVDRVVLVSGGARGLGLTQAGALLEAGAKGWANHNPP